jgi:hypothetical protein
MKVESRYTVHGNGESANTDDLTEAYGIAHGLAESFGHSFIFDNLENKKIDDCLKWPI